ncbi:unnamed protein product [Symbiodinium natans]|uniref:N-acetyltransferase domain-containing protein n=1 Tax=Symbiodinium natans TaxID=878477 RepID=A0A812U7D4_9DINO|nr:unnamed protein product [Symbiodinium natans]
MRERLAADDVLLGLVTEAGEPVGGAVVSGNEIRYFGVTQAYRSAGAARFLNEAVEKLLLGLGFEDSWLGSYGAYEALRLRQVSQRQAARPLGLCEVENAVERRTRNAVGLRRLGPWLPKGSACDCLLHCDRQHAPPATRPAGRRGGAQGWRRSVGPQSDQAGGIVTAMLQCIQAAGRGSPAKHLTFWASMGYRGVFNDTCPWSVMKRNLLAHPTTPTLANFQSLELPGNDAAGAAIFCNGTEETWGHWA